MDFGRNYLDPRTKVSLADAMRKAITDLEEVEDETRSYSGDFRLLARGLKLTLEALQSSMGECQGDTPYSPLRPVRQPDGTLKWCCNHDPEHCS